MSPDLPRYFAERISAIEPDARNGNIKLTFAVRSRDQDEDVAQVVMHVNDLRRAFGEVFEVVQRTFFDAPRAAREGAGAQKPLDDVTEG